VRPTGLLDPPIEVRPSINQIDDLLDEIQQVIEKDERVLVTTLTKRMAEEFSKYLDKLDIASRYIHSEVKTLDRIEILRDLRQGVFDVLVGVNLLREGLDLPEVSLVAIMDADKEGFLRSNRSLTQTAGRAARNVNGKVIMYADTITDSMQQTIDETSRRREKQVAFNTKHGLVPKQINKKNETLFENSGVVSRPKKYGDKEAEVSMAAEAEAKYLTTDDLTKAIAKTQKLMEKAAKELEFMEAAQFRDELMELKKLLSEKK